MNPSQMSAQSHLGHLSMCCCVTAGKLPYHPRCGGPGQHPPLLPAAPSPPASGTHPPTHSIFTLTRQIFLAQLCLSSCLVPCQHRGPPRTSFACFSSSTCLQMSRHSRTVTLGALCAARLILGKAWKHPRKTQVLAQRAVLTLTFINLRAVDHSGRHHLVRLSIAENTLQLMAKAPVGEKISTTLHRPCCDLVLRLPSVQDTKPRSAATEAGGWHCRGPGTHEMTMSWWVLSTSPLGLAEVMAKGPVMSMRCTRTVRSGTRIKIGRAHV